MTEGGVPRKTTIGVDLVTDPAGPDPVAYAATHTEYLAGRFWPWHERNRQAPVFAVRFADGRVFSVRDGWAPSGPVGE